VNLIPKRVSVKSHIRKLNNGKKVRIKQHSRNIKKTKSSMNIPLIMQKNKYLCSETSAEMILRYFGYEVSDNFQQELEDADCWTFEVFDECLADYIKCEHEEGNLQILESNLQNKIPTILRIVPDFQKERHSVVLIGFDDGNIIYNDPSLGRMIETKEDFLRKWNKTNNLMMSCMEK